MRTIKFRAWDSVRKEWRKDAEFFPVKSLNEKQDDVIWSQYTGLKDKNGKEIYEGDIVDYVLDYEHFQMVIDFVFQDNLTGYDLTDDNEPEVIGNIYENPELLKDGE